MYSAVGANAREYPDIVCIRPPANLELAGSFCILNAERKSKRCQHLGNISPKLPLKKIGALPRACSRRPIARYFLPVRFAPIWRDDAVEMVRSFSR
jgi:hypothetical protein